MNGLLPFYRGKSHQPLLSGSLNPPSSRRFAGQSSSFIAAAQTGQYKNRLSRGGTCIRLFIRFHMLKFIIANLICLQSDQAEPCNLRFYSTFLKKKTSAIHIDASKDLRIRGLQRCPQNFIILAPFPSLRWSTGLY